VSSGNQPKRVVWPWVRVRVRVSRAGPAWPAASSTTSHRPGSGWAEEEGWQEVKSSWEKAEFERKGTQEDGKTTVENSCLHCQRTLMSDHWAERNAPQEAPAQPWRVQVPVQPFCTIGGKAGA